jgi:hypothetical protein
VGNSVDVERSRYMIADHGKYGLRNSRLVIVSGVWQVESARTLSRPLNSYGSYLLYYWASNFGAIHVRNRIYVESIYYMRKGKRDDDVCF